MPDNPTLQHLRKWLEPIQKTPLHPQWLSYRDSFLRKRIQSLRPGIRILDIGCNDRWPEKLLPNSTDYIGLDYWSAEAPSYERNVDLYGDVRCLPFRSESFDVVFLFDVLEHVPDFDAAVREVHRITKTEAEVWVQVPFMYPLHDEPYDFRRLTWHGLEQAFSEFEVIEVDARGTSLESAALLLNIAIAEALSQWLSGFRILMLAVLAPFVLILIFLINCFGWCSSFGNSKRRIMPFSYFFRLRKVRSRRAP